MASASEHQNEHTSSHAATDQIVFMPSSPHVQQAGMQQRHPSLLLVDCRGRCFCFITALSSYFPVTSLTSKVTVFSASSRIRFLRPSHSYAAFWLVYMPGRWLAAAKASHTIQHPTHVCANTRQTTAYAFGTLQFFKKSRRQAGRSHFYFSLTRSPQHFHWH